MKRILAMLTVLALLTGFSAVCAESASSAMPRTTKLTARFATVEEGKERMRERTAYHNQINETMLPFILQKKGGSLDEYIAYSQEQVMEFTPEDQQRVNETLAWLQDQLEKHGLQLPDPGELTFVKSTGMEAVGAAGYTSGGTIFLTAIVFSSEKYTDQLVRKLIAHEISHCISRMYPEYRQALYSLIHFTLLQEDIDVPEEILEQVLANPDVERHDSYATFTINGVKKDCYLVFLSDSVFEKPGDTFFAGKYTGIVPLDEPRIYRVDEVGDFWDVVGQNTDYAEDPEEVTATNFSYAIVNLDEGYESFKSPEILEGIIEYLKK